MESQTEQAARAHQIPPMLDEVVQKNFIWALHPLELRFLMNGVEVALAARREVIVLYLHQLDISQFLSLQLISTDNTDNTHSMDIMDVLVP
jgi:hypothetical protein